MKIKNRQNSPEGYYFLIIGGDKDIAHAIKIVIENSGDKADWEERPSRALNRLTQENSFYQGAILNAGMGNLSAIHTLREKNNTTPLAVIDMQDTLNKPDISQLGILTFIETPFTISEIKQMVKAMKQAVVKRV